MKKTNPAHEIRTDLIVQNKKLADRFYEEWRNGYKVQRIKPYPEDMFTEDATLSMAVWSRPMRPRRVGSVNPDTRNMEMKRIYWPGLPDFHITELTVFASENGFVGHSIFTGTDKDGKKYQGTEVDVMWVVDGKIKKWELFVGGDWASIIKAGSCGKTFGEAYKEFSKAIADAESKK
jgi:hypothetical protein